MKKKSYKDFGYRGLGTSDIACLIAVGCGDNGIKTEIIHFGGDGLYRAYYVTEKDVEIGSHYKKVAEFDYWMRIYDDEELVFSSKAGKHIDIYRAGDFGIIIHEYDM